MRTIFDEMDDALSGFINFPYERSAYGRTYKGKWVDMERFDVVEKPEYRQRLIEAKEAEIAKIDKLHEERRERLMKELNELKNKRALSP